MMAASRTFGEQLRRSLRKGGRKMTMGRGHRGGAAADDDGEGPRGEGGGALEGRVSTEG